MSEEWFSVTGWPGESTETHSFAIPEYLCGGYGLLIALRFGLLATALGAAGYLLGKEISRKGLTTAGEVVMLPFTRQKFAIKELP